MQIFTSNHHICARASLQMPYAYIKAQLNHAAVVHTTTRYTTTSHSRRPSKRAKTQLQPHDKDAHVHNHATNLTP